jgi:uracil-DNA glycosylase family 4
MSDWDNIYKCPACDNENCVPPHNPSKSSVLLVGEMPGTEEESMGVPLVGRTGTLLRMQLAHMGYDLSQFGVCNLWQHKPNGNEKCLQHGKDTVIKEATDKKIVLLIGSDVAKVFLTKTISEVNGLNVKEFLKFPFSAPVVMAMMNPAICFHGCSGEITLALQKFIREVEKI